MPFLQTAMLAHETEDATTDVATLARLPFCDIVGFADPTPARTLADE
jgi:hypothetical protein